MGVGGVKSWPRSNWNGHSPEKRPGGKPELPAQEKEKEKRHKCPPNVKDRAIVTQTWVNSHPTSFLEVKWS